MDRNFNHTPGPWTLRDGAWPGFLEITGASFTITVVTTAADLDFEDFSKRSADARLIAAAPDLYEALNRVLGTVEHVYHTSPDTDGSLWADVLLCRDALAKASGVEE